MSIFDQRGQHVTYQYNAAGDINFGVVQNRVDLIEQLEKLRGEVAKAVEAQVIDAEIATEVDDRLTRAVQQANKPEPDKKSILDRINEAKALIGGITAASGMVTALAEAADHVQKLFP